MNLLWAVAGGIAGIPVGTLLRGAVVRFSVPSGEQDRTTCPWCAAPLCPWLPLRCGYCRAVLAAPAALEAATAIVFALLFGRFAGQPAAVAFGFLGALGVALAAIDIAVQRLPDPLTLPAYPVVIALLGASAAIGHDGWELARALLGGLALAGVYLLLAVARPGQLGGGDIKLAGLAGLVLGWLGWATLLFGGALGFFLSAIVSLALLVTRRLTLHSEISFGPFLLSGALLAMLAGI
jgi:leader peptidase (prepilin peptidase) / N-methyltransferase